MIKLNGWKPLLVEIECKKFGTFHNKFTKLGTVMGGEHIIPEYTPLSNQGNLQSCVGNACCDAEEILKGLEDPSKVQQLSRLFVYWDARAKIHEETKDEGCFISDALKSMNALGICREETWPYNESMVLKQPSIVAYKEASDNKIPDFDYYQITTNGEQRLADIETAIRANHPVIFGTQVGDDFTSYFNGAERVWEFPKTIAGGHAMIIVGIRYNAAGKREFYIRNSWGTTWGLQGINSIGQNQAGHCWFSSDYIEHSATGDMFVPTHMKDLLV